MVAVTGLQVVPLPGVGVRVGVRVGSMGVIVPVGELVIVEVRVGVGVGPMGVFVTVGVGVLVRVAVGVAGNKSSPARPMGVIWFVSGIGRIIYMCWNSFLPGRPHTQKTGLGNFAVGQPCPFKRRVERHGFHPEGNIGKPGPPHHISRPAPRANYNSQ